MLRSLSGLVFCRFPIAAHLRSLSVVTPNQPKIVSPNVISNQVTQKLDKLYKTITVEVRAHDEAVLNSYEFFATLAAKELGLNLAKVWDAKCHHKRRTLLKSAFVHKKHRVQYEFRTYFRFFEFKHLTGSTADTYLEYIQRNLPEGVSMKVTRHAIEKVPDHIANYIPEKES